MHLLLPSGDAIIFDYISIKNNDSLIEAGKTSLKCSDGRRYKLSRKKYKSSSTRFYFLPPSLSGKDQILALVRVLSAICTSQVCV